MATGLSSDLDSFREVLWQEVQALDASNDDHLQTLRILGTKRGERAPRSSNPLLQAELDKTHTVYQQWIQVSIENIQAQIELEKGMQTLYRGKIDLSTLPEACAAIEQRLMPLIQQQKLYEFQIKKFEDRIAELIQPNDPVEVAFFTKK